MFKQLRDKFPWYVFLLILSAVLSWRAVHSDIATTVVPGGVLFCVATVTMLLSLRIENYQEARRSWIRGILALLLGLTLLNAELFSPWSVAVAISAWILISLALPISSGRAGLAWILWTALGGVTMAVLFFDVQRWLAPVSVGIVGYELAASLAWLAKIKWLPGQGALLSSLDKSSRSDLTLRYTTIVAESEPSIRQVDNIWLAVLTFVLFGIHVERMGFTGNLGILPALIALICDFILALVIASVLLIPLRVSMTRLVGTYEDRAISIMANTASQPVLSGIVRFFLVRHIRLRIRLNEARFSLPLLLRQGLITGLPVVAIITATVPLLGISWFFDTEKWATISRDEWAAVRTDEWRMRMVNAANPDPNRALAIDVPGVGAGDFSFIVVGDPGQGGLSQRELAKRIVKTSEQAEVSFLLVSSDVVYPNGEMKDYEDRFWSPFSGLSKPILAIPGNHDWYDGLDSFAATFFKRDAARAAIAARSNSENADGLISSAEKLRHAYGLSVQQQTAPYFKVVSDHFVLICVDTGVVAGVDEMQMQWLRRALADARGKSKMVVLGHPMFRMNRNSTLTQRGLAPILELLRSEGVSIVMAGDTHDLEYYLDTATPGHDMHHFVNGGGGAFLSINRAFGSREMPVTDRWAYYPTREAITEKLDADVPFMVWPFWWLAKTFDHHPLSNDVLSTALDEDESPFLSSFVVVHVEASLGQVRIIPYGVYGRLNWSEFARSPDQTVPADDGAEWVIPLVKAQ